MNDITQAYVFTVAARTRRARIAAWLILGALAAGFLALMLLARACA